MTKVVFTIRAEIPDSHVVEALEDPYGYLIECAIGEIRSWETNMEVE